MTRIGWRGTWALCMALLASPAIAQDALLVSGHFLSASQNVGQDLGPAPFVTSDQIFGGARYGAFGAGNQVTVSDARTGGSKIVSGYLLAVDRARPRIVVARDAGLWLVDVTSGAELRLWSGDGRFLQHCALAESPNALYCSVWRPDGMSDVLAIGLATPSTTTIASLQLPYPARDTVFGWNRGGTVAWHVSSDGQRVYFGDSSLRLALLRTATGSVTPSPFVLDDATDWRPTITLDEVNDRVIVYARNADPPEPIYVVTADLTPLGSAQLPGSCVNAAISPHTGRLYLAQFPFDSCPACGGRLTLRVLDSSNYASLAPPVVPPGGFRNNDCRFVAVLSAPGAPRNLAATLTGSDVTLRWTNVGGASNFVLDVGIASGRTDLQIPVGPDAQVRVPGVPAGIYYVRVRGGNESGGGRASNEIRLVVP